MACGNSDDENGLAGEGGHDVTDDSFFACPLANDFTLFFLAPQSYLTSGFITHLLKTAAVDAGARLDCWSWSG